MPRLITFIFLLVLGFNPELQAFEESYLLKILDQAGQNHTATLTASTANRIRFAWNQKQKFTPVQPPVWRYRVSLKRVDDMNKSELIFNYDGESLVSPVSKSSSGNRAPSIYRISGTHSLNKLLNKTVGKQ